jgi:hypothetical protein
MSREDVTECERRRVDSRTDRIITQWSRSGVAHHTLHFVKHYIEHLRLDMSRVRIEMKAFV